MAKSPVSSKIQNIVATTSLGKDIPLTKLARTIQNTEYNPEQFPGLVLRVKQPKSAVLVFSSGNLVCTGTKSVSEVRKVIEQVIKILKKINKKVPVLLTLQEGDNFEKRQGIFKSLFRKIFIFASL